MPKIDRKATQKRVEEALETARIYKQISFVRREMKNTPAYEVRYHGATNRTTDAAAEVCVDKEEEIRMLTERVERAVSRLGKKEREIIQLRYLEDESFDYTLLVR